VFARGPLCLVCPEAAYLTESSMSVRFSIPVAPRRHGNGPAGPQVQGCRASADAFVFERLGLPTRNYYLGWSGWGNAKDTPRRNGTGDQTRASLTGKGDASRSWEGQVHDRVAAYREGCDPGCLSRRPRPDTQQTSSPDRDDSGRSLKNPANLFPRPFAIFGRAVVLTGEISRVGAGLGTPKGS
jgi:hypothetical protein